MCTNFVLTIRQPHFQQFVAQWQQQMIAASGPFESKLLSIMVGTTSDLLGGDASSSASPTMVNMPPKTSKEEGASDNITNALNSQPPATNNNNSNSSDRWGSMMGGMAGSLVNSARGVVSTAAASVSKQASDISSSDNTTESSNNHKATATPPSSGNAFFATLTSVSSAATNSSLVRGITQNITGKNTLPDKTTASQVLMFRQLLHTKCRPGLRLSRKYEGTAAQKAVLHMPWCERGIETSMKMIISYDNLITRLWLSGAIMPFERGGYGCCNDDNVVLPITNSPGSSSSLPGGAVGSIDTLVNERGLPPIPHNYWVDRLGFQQDDPVTDFRSGGVLSLAMLVHIVESCPSVHSRFVPKPKADTSATSSYISTDIISLEEIITDDASVLPFGITCINITDMLAKFLMFSKAVDKMDALLSAKPFWRMFIDPNAMLVLQEVSLDLLCDVCVEIGRERRIEKLKKQQEGNSDVSSLDDNSKKMKMGGGMPGSGEGKVTVFDFSEIIERTEKRVGEEVLGAGPQNVDELRAVARKVKSKYLMRIQLKEKHNQATSPLSKQIPPLPSAESVKNVMGNFAGLLKRTDSAAAAKGGGLSADESGSDVIDFSSEKEPTPRQEVEVHIDGTTSTPDDDLFASASNSVPEPATATSSAATDATPATTKDEATTTAAEDEGFDELDKLSAELGELSAVTSEAFDLLGDDFDMADIDAMDTKVDAFAAFAIDDEDEDFLS